MKIDIGPFSFSAQKTVHSKSSLKLSDIKKINDDTVSYLKDIKNDDLKARVDKIAFESLDDIELVRSALDEFGIVVIPGFLGRNIVEIAESVVEKARADISVFKESDEVFKETSEMLLQKGAVKVSGYSQLSGYGKAVSQIRKGQDEGMSDVFNIDLAFPELLALRAAYEKSKILDIISGEGERKKFRNLNLYLNENITSTRGFHVDSYSSQLKAFVYLTDCLELDDGPYTYVKGSHKDSAYRRFNRAASENLPNKTETPFVKVKDIIPVLAEKGSLVISDQSGFHRGFPQGEGHSRAISVMNIK